MSSVSEEVAVPADAHAVDRGVGRGRGRGSGGRGRGRGRGGGGREVVDDATRPSSSSSSSSSSSTDGRPRGGGTTTTGAGGGGGGGGGGRGRGRGGRVPFARGGEGGGGRGGGGRRPDRAMPRLATTTTTTTTTTTHDRHDDDYDECEDDDAASRGQHRHHRCPVCYSHPSSSTTITISPCGHDDVCWTCHLQMRKLHSDRRCPVCKSHNETLIVDHRRGLAEKIDDEANEDNGAEEAMATLQPRKFADYPMWGDEVVGGTHVHRADVGMHFPREMYEMEASPLLGYGCGLPYCEYDGDGDAYVCEMTTNANANANNANANANNANANTRGPQGRGTKKRLSGLQALTSHLLVEHGYALCDLCVDNKRDFVSRLARYTPRGLREHESVGDGDFSGFAGHPLCEFCRPTRFYDVVKLHEHLNREHYKCHVCDKSGRPNVFFKDYPCLERHFDGDHYLCRDPMCLASRFVVFENEIDLRGHEACVHGNASGGNAKIRLEFRIRRDGDDANASRDNNQSVPTGMDFGYGLDGEAFVPEALPDDDRRYATVGRQANEPEISHPAHAARTAELRAQAAMVRARRGGGIVDGLGGGGVAEAFPALGAADAYDPPSSSAASGNGISSGTLVGWTSDGVRAVAAGAGGGGGGGRGRAPAGLTRTSAGRVMEEEFPSLVPPPSSGGRGPTRNAIITGGIGRTTKRPTTTAGAAPTGPKFSAVAASSGTTTAASVSSARSRAPAVDGKNYPSLAERPGRPFVPSALASLTSSRASVPNLTSSDNFPSLGGGPSSTAGRSATRSNPYAAVEAHARKLNRGQAPSFGSSDFPPPPSSSSSSSNASKNAKIVDAFAPKKPPPLDNVLQFPPPPSSSSYPSSAAAKKAPTPFAKSLEAGRETVQSLKQLLGAARYKRLRSATRDFASGAIPPERYVDEAASLFDGGIGDGAFWDNIVPLIRDIPNATASNGAMGYLESIRLANEMQELEFGGGGGSVKKPIGYVLPTRKNKTVHSWGK